MAGLKITTKLPICDIILFIFFSLIAIITFGYMLRVQNLEKVFYSQKQTI